MTMTLTFVTAVLRTNYMVTLLLSLYLLMQTITRSILYGTNYLSFERQPRFVPAHIQCNGAMSLITTCSIKQRLIKD